MDRFATATFPVEIRRRRHLCFVNVFDAGQAAEAREPHNAAIFDRLEREGIESTMVVARERSLSFAVDGHDASRLAPLLADRDAVLCTRDRCTRIRVAFCGVARTPRVRDVVAAINDARIDVIHVAADDGGVSVLVHDRDGFHAAAMVERYALNALRSL